MKTFTDAAGRTWALTLNLGTAMLVKAKRSRPEGHAYEPRARAAAGNRRKPLRIAG